ncbi:MTA/SAH nucleosidase [Alkalihalobacillus alcalophilus ATCC 27647 = CGMCC 1.3604]|uniref:adenosylhomocysteine nucleosidase n=2 Tax=Alkalihalobacillus alcalophilus TaxID=1445 RepID=A0A094WIG0_ALKAL|nr:5'-methylthioadenosine/adenosylhomocysteine nucleosidase [Alkalihalobacillus alcalophilus]KGA96616.1 MTA/SAH nucleosidase [Alkalihalobacillus alcalophilus ATCC 27647 = CGMCC 1.3604]MED1561693.1 5'-methylthioadenosine/adenosylhomocysteine nucleosidase [Alkalihalobacillus alcalophilus]THG92262.1 MTA/SAH nucleosidase [Alkalihalobacillus alcalophilus ATCC 27647 = CGMCC 1.3604]
MKVGIIGAMQEEIEQMKAEMDIQLESNKAGVTFYEGLMLEHDIVLCKSGVGKVNAALTTQILIDTYKITHLIFTGVAGGLLEALNVGDIVVSTSAMQHDIDGSALGFKKGEIPMQEGTSDFVADPVLVEIAEQAAIELSVAEVIKGRVLSGDQFVADRDKVVALREEFDGVCVEMEGAAVAQVAALNDVPFVIIRSISDKANGEASLSFADFTKLASKQSHDFVCKMLIKL